MRARLSLVLTTALAMAMTATTRAEQAASPEYVVPFEIESNLLIVQGTVNDKGPVKFAIDTGADYNQILPATARRIGLIDDSFDKLAHPTGTLRVGNAVGDGEEFRVEDYPGLVRANKSFGIEGTVGFPFLSKHRMVIDYRAKKMTLRRYDDVRAFPKLKELAERKEKVKELFAAKKLKEAAAELEKIGAEAPRGSMLGYSTLFNAARCYASMGDADKTAAVLTTMRGQGYALRRKLAEDGAFKKVLENPKIKTLLAAEKTDPGKVPFEFDRSHIVLESTLNGKGPYKTLLDTGSTFVTVTPETAKALGLTQTTLESVRIGAVEMRNVTVNWTSPLTAMMKEFGTDVLLGGSFLKEYRMTIDYLNKELTLERYKQG